MADETLAPGPPAAPAPLAEPVPLAEQAPVPMVEPDPDQVAELAAVPTPEAVVVPVLPQTPHYNVIAQRANDRPDNMATYYVVIDPINMSTDGFKIAVKQVLDELTAANGGPMFSAYIWDNLEGAQTEVSYKANPDLFSDELFAARKAFNDQHLVAKYVGGLSSAGEPPAYVLLWFPDSEVRSPNSGQWVSAEIWKP